MDEYLCCPSDSSPEIYPHNTLANFTMHLSKPMEFDSDDYEVGLSELQYPRSWDNVRRDRNKIVLICGHGESWMWQDEIIIAPGYYKSIADLVTYVQDQINLRTLPAKAENETNLKGLFFKHQSLTNQVTINAKNMELQGYKNKTLSKNVRLVLKGDIAQLFGFADNTVIKSGMIKDGHEVARTDGKFFQMHVYSTILLPQQYGGEMQCILRTIAISARKNPDDDFIAEIFHPVRYYPISSRYITDINFQFRDNNGELVGFQTGTVLAVLHFRKKLYI